MVSQVPLSRDGSLSPRSPKGEEGRADDLLASPHFSMDTPPSCGSRANSPSPPEPVEASSAQPPQVSSSSGRNAESRTPTSPISKCRLAKPGEGSEYDWQTEILNSLPSEKARALVDHIRKAEQERAESARLALELSTTNNELYKRLRGKVTQGQQDANRCCGTRTLLSVFSLLAVVLAVFLSGSVPSEVARQQLLHGIDLVRGVLDGEKHPNLNDSTRGSQPNDASKIRKMQSTVSLGPGPAEESMDQLQAFNSGGDRSQSSSREVGRSSRTGSKVELKDGKVRETTVREMTMRETTTREYDAKVLSQLQSENLQMKLQLERLWLDIDDAVHKGQDMVCWKV
eukprot:TRINITY_DN37667_c0_g1_i1.p1 TRINITY_DN37667_c0_g1~~TRINITY_DN37667_c0_g1_i1.p1  ORF type:complete len:354 (+),score=45.79 TRINITY_DN37667_c0_g1_i1:36-1064(+)